MSVEAVTISNSRAWATFVGMLATPILTFAVAFYALVSYRVTESLPLLLAVYIVGTTPGLILGVRYPAEAWRPKSASLLVT